MIHGEGEPAEERSWRSRLFGGLRVEAAGVPLAGRAGQKKRVARQRGARTVALPRQRKRRYFSWDLL
jgi:hypothetical protein